MNNCQILLSIIIPAYNAQNTLSRCIGSIINEKLEWIEIIIIDDNSNDNSFLIFQKKIMAQAIVEI